MEKKHRQEREREERRWEAQKEDPAITEMREAMLSQMQAQTQLMTQLAEGGIKQREKEETKKKKKAINPDWKPEVDPTTGDTYYHNPKTGETAWEPPPPKAESPRTQLEALQKRQEDQKMAIRKKMEEKEQRRQQRIAEGREDEESSESDESLAALLQDSEDSDDEDAEALAEKRQILQAERLANQAAKKEVIVTPLMRFRAAWIAVLFYTGLSMRVRAARAAQEGNNIADFEQLMYAAIEYGSSWLHRTLTLPLGSIVDEPELNLEVVLPDDGGFFGWGAVTQEEIDKRINQSKVRVCRVMQLLVKEVNNIPSSVLSFLQYLISMHVHFPNDPSYLFNSEKLCLQPEDWGMFSVTNDQCANFLILKFFFVRLLIFNVMLGDGEQSLMHGAKAKSGEPRENAIRNIRVLGSQLYWLHSEYLKSDFGRPLLTIGIWKEVLSDLDGDGTMDRYWWNIETGETAWDLPEDAGEALKENDENIDDEQSRREDLQPFLENPLLSNATQAHITSCLPLMNEWVNAVLDRIKLLSKEDNMGRKYYWDASSDQEAVPLSPRRRKNVDKKGTPS